MNAEHLREQFIEVLNWNRVGGRARHILPVEESEICFDLIAEVAGVIVAMADPIASQKLSLPERKSLALQFQKIYREHILVFPRRDDSFIWHTHTVNNERTKHFEVTTADHISKIKAAIAVETGKERSLNDLALSKDKAFESCQRDYLKRVAVDQVFAAEGFHLADSPRNKSCFIGATGKRVVCTYSDSRPGFYWFGFHDRWSEFLKQGAESVAILVCADNQTAIFLPFKHLKARLKSTNKTRTWHHLKVQAEGLHLPKNGKDSFWNLAPYTREIVLPLASHPVSAT